MKTNHQRDFKDPGSFRDPSMLYRTRKLSTRFIGAHIGNDFANGHHGAARAKSGLKHYLRAQERKDGKIQCKEWENWHDEAAAGDRF